jgi:hypothetical protein
MENVLRQEALQVYFTQGVNTMVSESHPPPQNQQRNVRISKKLTIWWGN